MKIIENLLKCGIAVKEVAKFSGDESEIVITLPYKDVFNPLLTKAVSEITGYKSIISCFYQKYMRIYNSLFL
mgnify:CR=1 FL=1